MDIKKIIGNKLLTAIQNRSYWEGTIQTLEGIKGEIENEEKIDAEEKAQIEKNGREKADRAVAAANVRMKQQTRPWDNMSEQEKEDLLKSGGGSIEDNLKSINAAGHKRLGDLRRELEEKKIAAQERTGGIFQGIELDESFEDAIKDPETRKPKKKVAKSLKRK